MRVLKVALGLSVLSMFSIVGIANASDQIAHSEHAERYSGFYLDLSAIAGQQNYAETTNWLHQQIELIGNVGLSQRVLQFFHTIPIVVDEAACLEANSTDNKPPTLAAACYGPSAPVRLGNNASNGTYFDKNKSEWINADPIALAEDTHLGVVAARPLKMAPNSPVLLHEMLHAYHSKVLPHGASNQAIKFYYDKAKTVFPADAYLMTNEREYFAVTASVFLYGNDHQEPFTRSKLKEKQPEYFKFLVWLFGFDPDSRPTPSPVASAN